MIVGQSAINRACAGHTVNGRTLMATLMEEAPSAAAMMACVGYASEVVRVIMTRSPRILMIEGNQSARLCSQKS